MYQSEGQGKFAAANPYLAEHTDLVIFYSAERPHTATNLLGSWCHSEMEGQRGFSGWVRRVPGVL